MQIIYNTEKLNTILKDLSLLTGIAFGFTNKDGEYITTIEKGNDFCTHIQKKPENKEKCALCDMELLKKGVQTKAYQYHICHSGLYDATIPIIKDGIYSGSVIMGRIRTAHSPQKPFNTKNALTVQKWNELPYFTNEQIESLKTLLPNILFESAISFEYNNLCDNISLYIKNNLTKNLTIPHLCKKFSVSKNALYKVFKENNLPTINNYILNERISLAKKLLSTTNMPIDSIAHKTGINNYSYFFRKFKNLTGFTPKEYREQCK